MHGREIRMRLKHYLDLGVKQGRVVAARPLVARKLEMAQLDTRRSRPTVA